MAKLTRIEVVSGFRHQGQDLGPGSVLDLDNSICRELMNAKKAIEAEPNAKPCVKPMPERKLKEPEGYDRIAALETLVGSLAATVEKLAAQPKAKEKANA